MKYYQEALEYHLEHRLTKVAPKFRVKLTDAQISSIEQCLSTQESLSAIRVKSTTGRTSFEKALRGIDSASNLDKVKHKPSWLGSIKVASSAMAVVLVFVAIGGYATISGTTPVDTLSSSSVKPNGSLENLSNLNIADAQNDINNSYIDTSAEDSAKVTVSSMSTIDEALDEN